MNASDQTEPNLDREEAAGLLEETYQGKRLEDALDALDYADDMAAQIADDETLIPVWPKEEVLAMGDES